MEISWRRGEDKNHDLDIDDDAIVKEAIDNANAFAPLYWRYSKRVFRYVYSRVENQKDAEDITSQVFTDALSALPRYRSRGRFAGWLFTFAYRRCADFHRRPIIEKLPENISAKESGDPADQVIEKEIFTRMEHILSSLREDERELLRLHYVAELTYREIADVLGRNQGAVKMAMSRVIQKIKIRWEDDDEQD